MRVRWGITAGGDAGGKAAAGTPDAIVSRLNAETMKIIAAPEFRQRLSGEGLDPLGSSPEEFSAYLKREVKKWGSVIRAAKISAD